MALVHTSLLDYYKQNDQLISLHNYSLADIEQMVPYERDLYTDIIIQRIREQP